MIPLPAKLVVRRTGRWPPTEAVVRACRQAVLALGFMVAVGASAAGGAQKRMNESAPQASAVPSSSYLIGPGDVLQIMVWKDPDLSRDVTVRLDGMITVPLLGDLQAAGRAPSELAKNIAAGLGRYVEGPRVAVAVSQATSARFYVIGQVTKSGEFPLSGNTTVLQGLALAGGFREFAKVEDIVVIQKDGTVIGVNYRRLADGKDVQQNIPLHPGDTIVVP
jgi:polysaccharide export outer membrane protein